MSSSVKWDETKLQGVLKVKTEAMLGNAAKLIEGKTKEGINQLDLIDTGFMINSVYSATEKRSGYSKTYDTGRYEDREGNMVPRERSEEIVPAEGEAVVHVAAEYFIDWELRYSILYGALVATANELKGE